MKKAPLCLLVLLLLSNQKDVAVSGAATTTTTTTTTITRTMTGGASSTLARFSCPSPDQGQGQAKVEVPSNTRIHVEKTQPSPSGSTSTGSLCTLIRVTMKVPSNSNSNGDYNAYGDADADAGSDMVAPVARSYNGFDWENVAGPYASTLVIICHDDDDDVENVCEIQIPEVEPNEHFYLIHYTRSLAAKNEAARFFEQTTFGTTRRDIQLAMEAVAVPIPAPAQSVFGGDNVDDDDAGAQKHFDLQPYFSSWLYEQMYNVQPTLHRAVWRERASSTTTAPVKEGTITHPCQLGARWRNAAFTVEDEGKYMTISIGGSGNNSSRYRYALSVDGHVRTMVDEIEIRGKVGIDDNALPMTFELCKIKDKDNISFRIAYDGKCIDLRTKRPFRKRIPVVDLDGMGGSPVVLDINETLPNFVTQVSYEDSTVIESMVMVEMSNAPWDSAAMCGGPSIPIFDPTTPVFAKLQNGQVMMYESRILLQNNSLSQPLEDGGGGIVKATQDKVECANVPRTFLNNDSCRMSKSEDACSNNRGFASSDQTLVLDKNTILDFHKTTGREIYAVTGLSLDDPTLNYPCDGGTKSRWISIAMLDESMACTGADGNEQIDEQTAKIFRSLIQTSTDANSHMKDIYFSSNLSCHRNDRNRRKFYLTIEKECWTNVHPNEFGVYDFRSWKTRHPGGRRAISQFKMKSEFLPFPQSHDVSRWRDNSVDFPYLGRLGDSTKVEDLPRFIRNAYTVDESDIFQVSLNGPGVMVCGSPGESANTYPYPVPFEMTRRDVNEKTTRNVYWEKDQIRKNVWTTVVLSSKDQVRQRIAWALSQILAVSPDIFDTWSNEMFTTYYDIFVRNAHGNYKDILREVSYSPLMADMLTYYESKSQEIIWRTKREIQFADENYAREILQLFSIGLYRLNIDGTYKLDDDGNKMLVYTNDDIEEYARVWTGFTRQDLRGNIEAHQERKGDSNSIDPMKINANWRDPYPKMGLDGKYIGDGYMLCADIPAKSFLKKGATYRLLGKAKLSDVQRQFIKNSSSDADIYVTVLDEHSSLREKLCNTVDGNCQYLSTVTIDHTLGCNGSECELDQVHVVEVAENIYYEYMKTPCVRHVLFDTGQVAAVGTSPSLLLCIDKNADSAAAACCPIGSNNAKHDSCKYTGEVLPYEKAKARCIEDDMGLCQFTSIDALSCGTCCSYEGIFWYGIDNGCTVIFVVDKDGKIALERQDSPRQDYDSLTFFRVHWENDYPSLGNQCGNSICESIGNYCRCIPKEETEIFYKIAPQSHDVLKDLHIGGVPPSMMDYSATEVRDGIKIHFRNQIDVYDKDVVFEVKDEFGRILFSRNIINKVKILGSNGLVSDDFGFRNPPTFMKQEAPEVRDAQYETEAALDHIFYHHNSAPFLANWMIQRLGNSNPSPRLVASVSKAFKSGVYVTATNSFGSSTYGDLSATVAAIIMDREFRYVVLDEDMSYGSLREPLLKVIAIMRSMEYIQTYTKLSVGLYGAIESLGEMAHEIPSVFSFFSANYASPGGVSNAFLRSPEGILSHKTPGMLNGMYSLVKFGLTGCYGGFGQYQSKGCNSEGVFDKALGHLTYDPSFFDEDNVIDELSTLLTSGRVVGPNRELIKKAYLSTMSMNQNQAVALRVAQQLFFSSAEFHTNGIPRNTNIRKDASTTIAKKSCIQNYKAVVHLNLRGGLDSYNLLVPHSGCSGLASYEQYAQVRGAMGLPKTSLLQIDASSSSQPCDRFGIHPSMPFLKKLYDEKDASFIAGIGVLSTPVTKDDYNDKTRTTLFAHNTMRDEIDRLDPYLSMQGTGILGRFADDLTAKGYSVNSFSVDSGVQRLEGKTPTTVKKALDSKNGVQRFNPSDIEFGDFIGEQAELLNGKVEGYNNVFSDVWSEALYDARNANEFYWAQQKTNVTEEFSAEDFIDAKQSEKFNDGLKAIAQMVGSSECRGSERDLFYIEYGSFDHHRNMIEDLANKLSDLDQILESFVDEMKAQALWDQVTIVVSSDFGRTLTGNSAAGTDHGWSGHSFILGGALDGGKIHGKYPSDLENSQLRRSRVIPEVPWEAQWNAAAQWLGIEDEQGLSHALPNRLSFPSTMILDRKNVFLTDDLINASCDGEGEPISCSGTVATNVPTAASSHPSNITSTAPSSVPSSVPKSESSLQPSSGPSSQVPSLLPSLKASSHPSTMSSSTPSLSPTPSGEKGTIAPTPWPTHIPNSFSPNMQSSSLVPIATDNDNPSKRPSLAPVKEYTSKPSNEKTRNQVPQNAILSSSGETCWLHFVPTLAVFFVTLTLL